MLFRLPVSITTTLSGSDSALKGGKISLLEGEQCAKNGTTRVPGLSKLHPTQKNLISKYIIFLVELYRASRVHYKH